MVRLLNVLVRAMRIGVPASRVSSLIVYVLLVGIARVSLLF